MLKPIKKRIKVACPPKESPTMRWVRAFVYPCGLAVHPKLGARGPRSAFWTITHIPTGYAVGSHIESEATAHKIVTAIAHLVDWNSFTTLDKWAPMEGTKQLNAIIAAIQRIELEDEKKMELS